MTTTNPRQSRGGSLRPRSPQPETESKSRSGAGRHGALPDRPAPAAGRRTSGGDVVVHGTVPPTGLLLARPLLLLLAALIGGLIGFLAAGGGGYKASAVLEYSVSSPDSNVAKQTGQTLARTSTAQTVVDRASAALGTSGSDLAARLTAEWQTDTRLVTVSVTAPSEQQAIDSVNTVANTVIQVTAEGRQAALNSALQNSTSVLNGQALTQQAAEEARQAQIGAALGTRQDSIAGDSNALFVADPAITASGAGLSRALGLAIGVVAGLLLGGLVALLLGLRGLRVTSGRTLRTLLPDTEISSTGQVATLAGEIVESGATTVAVVATNGALSESAVLGDDLAAFLRAHGKTVTVLSPEQVSDRAAALALLGRDVRDDVPAQVGTDVLLTVLPADSDAAALLEGQSDLRSLIVARRRRTTVATALKALTGFARSQPVLVLAK